MIFFMVLLALATMSEASYYYSVEAEVPEGRIAADPTFYRRLDHIRGHFDHKPFGHFWAKYWVKNRNQRREKRQVGNYNSYYADNQIPYYNPQASGVQTQGFVQRVAQTQSFAAQNQRFAQQQQQQQDLNRFIQYPRLSQDQRFGQEQRFRFRQNPRPRTTAGTTAKPKKKPFRPPMVFF